MEEQKHAEEDVRKLKRLQRSKRRELFDIEDETEAKRDEMNCALQKQTHQQCTTQGLFKIRRKIE